jgi:hypothetical protein
MLRDISKPVSSKLLSLQQGKSHLYMVLLKISFVSPGQKITFLSQAICVSGKGPKKYNFSSGKFLPGPYSAGNGHSVNHSFQILLWLVMPHT